MPNWNIQAAKWLWKQSKTWPMLLENKQDFGVRFSISIYWWKQIQRDTRVNELNDPNKRKENE